MNHYKLTPIQWNSGLKLKAGMVVIFENGYYQSLKGRNSGEPKDNYDFVYIGEVDRFGSVAKIDASNILETYVDNWLDALSIYTIPEVDELLSKKADLVGGVVPANQLPSYVDDVIEGYYQDGDFYKDSSLTQSILGEAGKLYLDLFKSETYRWTGSVFLKVGGSALKLGIADDKEGINGYEIVNENVFLIGFFTGDFNYSYTEDPQNPGLNIPTISLKVKPVQATLTDNKIPVWNQTEGKLVDSEIHQTADKKIGIGKTNPTQKVDIEGNIKANVLVSKTYTVAERNAISNPVEGMIVYQSESPKGFYKYENSAWIQIGSNISNSDLTNTSARTFTQANTFTWNTAGQFYYLKGLLDKTGSAAYMKSVMVHATTGEKVTRDADDPLVVTSAINKASTAQRTSMRTALLGTATPANPVLNDASPKFITKGISTIDLYGLNLTLLDPTQIWIEKADGSRVYAVNYYNLTETAVTVQWDIPLDLPNGNYPIKIQNGVTVQGLSTAFLTVVDSISEIVFPTVDWKRKLRLKTDGTEGTINSAGLLVNSAEGNIVKLWDNVNNISGFDSSDPLTYIGIIFKSKNIFLGAKDWDIKIDLRFLNGNQATSNFLPYIGLTETTHENFLNTQSLINNHYTTEATAQVRLLNATSGIFHNNNTDTTTIYISKVGSKLYYKLYNRITYSQITYLEQNIDTSKDYALFFRDGYHNGWNFEKQHFITARIMN